MRQGRKAMACLPRAGPNRVLRPLPTALLAQSVPQSFIGRPWRAGGHCSSPPPRQPGQLAVWKREQRLEPHRARSAPSLSPGAARRGGSGMKGGGRPRGGPGPHEHRPRPGTVCGMRLHLPTLIGMGLFFFFTSQIFSASPFQSFTNAPGGGEASEEAAVIEEPRWALFGNGGSGLQVSTKSHAYLRPAFWDRRPDAFVANVSAWYVPRTAEARQQLLDTPSFYKQWIEKDLEPWKGGITRDLVESTAQLYDVCDGDMIRFQILNGSLWVHHVTDRAHGWYPAILGPNNAAAKGRIPYTILILMDVLRMFPGQIPDVDAVLHTADFTCIPRSWEDAGGGAPLPVLGFQGSEASRDITFPDYTFWGHEYQYLQDPWGHPAHGWAGQATILARKYANVSLADRVPQAMWRGRIKDERYPQRDALRRTFVGCVKAFEKEGREGDAALISVLRPPVALQDSCDYRYNVYLETEAWVSNLKQKMVCGSVLVAPMRMRFHEWWTRSLVPGQHYVEVTDKEEEMCDKVTEVVRDMNVAFASPAGRAAVPSTGQETPTLAKRLHQLRSDHRTAQLLGLDGSPPGTAAAAASLGRAGAAGAGAEAEASVGSAMEQGPVVGPGGNYSWGSSFMPWELAAAGQKFVQEHVRMEDALVYIRDLLRAYATLQEFKVKPVAKSQCYTGDRLLEQFGFPHEGDAAVVAKAYPWLRGYDAGCKAAQAVWGSY